MADEAIARGKNPLLPSSVDEADEFIRWVAEKPPPLPKPMRVFAIRRHIEARARLTSYFDVLHTEAGWTGLPEDWSAITAPALVIHGARDRVIDPATAEALTAQLPSAELRMLAGIGHVPQIEVPKLVAKLMEGFLP